MTFNYGDIFQNYLQVANFVAQSLERTDARKQQQEEDELQSVAGKAIEIFAPRHDKEGNLLPGTSGDILTTRAAQLV